MGGRRPAGGFLNAFAGFPGKDRTQQPIQTGLGAVDFGGAQLAPESFSDVDALIESRTEPALGLLEQGSSEKLRLQELGLGEAVDPLQSLVDSSAFEEQQSLLGLRGQDAQRQSIGSIPLTDFDREFQRRQQQRLLRGAAARGEAGGGATLQAGAQLAGAQQADIIGRRLAQLEPLSSLQRGLSGTISQLQESGLAQRANTEAALGTQLAGIRLGTTAPQIQALQNRAELSGLRGIAKAQQQGQIAQQLTGLAGTFFGGQ
jgi:hypothetical protein